MSASQDISQRVQTDSWRWLIQVAYAMVQDAQMRGQVAIQARLGGGARVMLAIEHRLAADVDIFIHDANWVQWLTPRVNDKFRKFFDSYQEQSNSLKLIHPKGEIDFIVAGTLFPAPIAPEEFCGFACESVAEVLAKKLFYRAQVLAARDVFDWWSVAHKRPELIPDAQMSGLLQGRLLVLREALGKIVQSSFSQTQWDRMQAAEKPKLSVAIAWAQEQISQYEQKKT